MDHETDPGPLEPSSGLIFDDRMLPPLLTAQRTAQRLQKLWTDWRGTHGQIYFQHRVSEYRAIWQAVAADIGASFEELADDVWELRKGSTRTRICNYQLELDNPVILELAGNKPLVHRLLAQGGLAVPEHLTYTLEDLAGAQAFAARFPEGTVVKPAAGYGGKGVTTAVRTAARVKDASVLASLYGPELLIERQIPGECFRLLVFDGKLIGAVRRTGVRVAGEPGQVLGDLLRKRGVELDDDVRSTLRAQSLSLGSEIPAGVEHLVRSKQPEPRSASELRTVYDTHVLGEVAEPVRRAAEQAAAIVGSRLLGVDIITVDIRRDLFETGGVVNEVNTTPALHHHYFSRDERYPREARIILERLLSP